MADPTGESDIGALRLGFDHRLLVQFRSSVITSDAGLLACGELHDALGLPKTVAETLAVTRTRKNGGHRLAGIILLAVLISPPLVHADTGTTVGSAQPCEIEQTDTKVLDCLTKMAEGGDDAAAAMLGQRYYDRNLYDQAVKWLKIAADHNDPISQFDLGWMYNSGNGVSQSVKDAIHWYELSSSQGIGPASMNLGLIFEEGPPEYRSNRRAFSHYLNAAVFGYDRAFIKVGMYYTYGIGTVQDLSEGVHWLERAARSGYNESYHILSVIYYDGLTGSPDFVEAYKWLLLYKQSMPSIFSRDMASNAEKIIQRRLTAAEISDAESRVKKWKEKKTDDK